LFKIIDTDLVFQNFVVDFVMFFVLWYTTTPLVLHYNGMGHIDSHDKNCSH